MNILIVSQYFWPEGFLINDLAVGLREKGHQVTVLTGIPNYPAGRFFKGYSLFGPLQQDYHGVNVLRVPLIPRGRGGGIRLAINFLSFALSSLLAAPFLKLSQIDGILVFQLSPVTVGLPAILLKKIASAPIAFWVQDLWPESLSATGAVRNRQILAAVARLVRFIYRRCDLILMQSKAFAESIVALGGEQQRLRYLPNYAQPLFSSFSSAGAVPPQLVELPSGFRVMFAGNIGAAQGFATILGAAELLKGHEDIHWIILGDGRKRSWVEEQVSQRGLGASVHLLGRHPLETMPWYFAQADVMLVTLNREPIFALTIPSKVQAYLACGKPIVGSIEGEGARIIREAGAGLTPAAESAEELAGAVLAMYRMGAEERQAMGERGREYFAAHFERNMLIDRLCDWFEELHGTTAGRGR